MAFKSEASRRYTWENVLKMIVVRKKEKELLDYVMNSGQAEFVAIYGRRRVGKTFLIREYCH